MPRLVAICSLALAMLVVCSRVENCAIWAMNSLLSVGFIGSWFCIWATNSLRKSSLPRDFVVEVCDVVDGEPWPVTEVTEVIGWLLGEDVHQDAVGEGEGL